MNIHPTSKIIVVIIVGLLTYLVAFYSLSPLIPNDRFGQTRKLASISTTSDILLNGASALFGLIAMLLTSLVLFNRKNRSAPKKIKGSDDFSILKRALTKDEVALLSEVRKSPDGITQDSLRFRLNWSKAKVSTMLTNLDRMGIVQRERLGKTYKIRYQSRRIRF